MVLDYPTPHDCTASLERCSQNTWRLTSSVKIISAPGATSWAELYVAEGFNFANRNLAWDPCWQSWILRLRITQPMRWRQVLILSSLTTWAFRFSVSISQGWPCSHEGWEYPTPFLFLTFFCLDGDLSKRWAACISVISLPFPSTFSYTKPALSWKKKRAANLRGFFFMLED